MFWAQKTDKGKELKLYHVRGTVLERGEAHDWAEEHPYGWGNIHHAVEKLEEKFRERGWMNSRNREQVSSCVSQIKEKFGQIRVYVIVSDEDWKEYLDILQEFIEEFPGIQDYLSPDFAEEVTAAVTDTDDREETEEYIKLLEQKSDEELLRMGDKEQ